MTMPNGQAGLDTGAWLAPWVSFADLASLGQRDQATITTHYETEVHASTPWQAASDQFFQGILKGYNDLESFLNLLTNAMTGAGGGLTALQAFFTEQWDNLAATILGLFNTNGWLGRLITDVLILLDVFQTTYEYGSPSDSTTQLGTNGKRTYWSAWNDLMAVLTNSTGATVSNPVPAIGSSITAGAVHTQSVADAVNQGVIPTSQTGATSPLVNSTVASLTQAVSGLQSQVTNLQSSVNGPTTVLRDTGQDSPGTGLGANWTASTSNTVNRDAAYGFKWQTSGAVARLEVGIYDTPLATNDQVGAIVINSLMSYWPADFYGGSYYQYGAPENWIILRADSPTSPNNFVFAKIRVNDVQFGYVQSGSAPVMLGTPTTFKCSSASSYTFYAGDASSDYNFKLVSGGHTVATYTDSAHVTAFAVPNRYSGQAWKSDAGNGGAEAVPAATSWQSYDAAASAGSPIGFGWVTRLSATTTFMTNGFLPYDFFDNAVSLGTGIQLPTSGNAGLQVTQAGLYSVNWGLQENTTPNATDLIPGVAVNGVLTDTGPTFMYDGGGVMLGGGQYGMASAGVLANAGDVISPVMLYYNGLSTGNRLNGVTGSSSSATWRGDNTGTRSFFKIAKIG